MRIEDMVVKAYNIAKSKGWHSSRTRDILMGAQRASKDFGVPTTGNLEAAIKDVDANAFGARLALINSEVAEALEAYRERGLETWVTEKGKPEGVIFELADVLIRIGDLVGALRATYPDLDPNLLDLEAAVIEKMAFNETRSHRHGGKAL